MNDEKEIITADQINEAVTQACLPLSETGQDVEHSGQVIEFNEVGEDAIKRGPGRPPGSKNKRAEDWQNYILKQYRSPLILYAETYSRPLAELKAELHCTALEAFKVQLDAASKLAPYVHQKLPQMVEVKTEELISLTMLVSSDYAEIAKKQGITIEQVEEVEIPELEEPEKSDINQ